MDWTPEQIRQSFSGRLIGSSYMKKIICETLFCLPLETSGFVTANIWFISSPGDAWAFTFRGSDIKGQYLIVLSEDLLRQRKSRIRYTILHEIGHVLLGHKNSIGYRQSQSEIQQQEAESDQFAKKFD